MNEKEYPPQNDIPWEIQAYAPLTEAETLREARRAVRRRELVRPDWPRRARAKREQRKKTRGMGQERVNIFNNLFVYFVLTQGAFFITPYFAAPPLLITVDIQPALWVHAFAMLAFIGGYALNSLLYAVMHAPRRATAAQVARCSVRAPRLDAKRDVDVTLPPPEEWIFSDAFFKVAYTLLLVGTIIVVLQIAVFENPLAYLGKLLTGHFDSTIRDAFLAPSEVSGISGVLKMFGAVPLSAYLFTMSLPNFIFMSPANCKRFEVLNKYSLAMTFVKILSSLDRLTIVAVVIANIFMTVRTRKNILPKVLAVVAFAVLIEFVSQRRVAGQGALGFMVLYYNLGIVNLQWMINSVHGYTRGFALLLAPLTFVMKFIGLSKAVPTSDYSFEYAGAEYIVGYAWQDYGPLYWWLFVFIGYLYKTIDRKALLQQNAFFASIYLLVLSTTITFVAVPSIKSVDFWLGVLVPLFLLRYFARRVPHASQTPMLESSARMLRPHAVRRALRMSGVRERVPESSTPFDRRLPRSRRRIASSLWNAQSRS